MIQYNTIQYNRIYYAGLAGRQGCAANIERKKKDRSVGGGGAGTGTGTGGAYMTPSVSILFAYLLEHTYTIRYQVRVHRIHSSIHVSYINTYKCHTTSSIHTYLSTYFLHSIRINLDNPATPTLIAIAEAPRSYLPPPTDAEEGCRGEICYKLAQYNIKPPVPRRAQVSGPRFLNMKF